jgi:NAD(P)-dependent dehydrogenase (short-subunit alcohol dehydrogenase family)
MSLLVRFLPNGRSGFGSASTAEDVTEGLELSGRSILITGSNSGLGLETARVLALRGARVLAVARTVEKAQHALAGLPGNFIPLACDLADPDSVRACVATVKQLGLPLDAIVCNAGIMALPKLSQAFGYELQFFTNHIGHFMLVTGLLEMLGEQGRVVMVSSTAHRHPPSAGIDFDNLSGERGYRPWEAYGQSKLANVLFAKQLAKRLAGTRRTANAVHPGVIPSPLSRHLPAIARGVYASLGPLLLKDMARGAATQCYVATHPALAGVSGEYFADCNVKPPSAHARNDALAERLWIESERVVAALPSS